MDYTLRFGAHARIKVTANSVEEAHTIAKTAVEEALRRDFMASDITVSVGIIGVAPGEQLPGNANDV